MAILVLATILAKNILDTQIVLSIQTTLDLPTAITLVAFSILSIKLELDKPKYRQVHRNGGNYDTLLLAAGIVLTSALIYLKYFY